MESNLVSIAEKICQSQKYDYNLFQKLFDVLSTKQVNINGLVISNFSFYRNL